MQNKNIRIDFQDGKEPKQKFLLYEKIIKDRGSVYSVCIGNVKNREEVTLFLNTLKTNKKYAKADHNSYALRIRNNGGIFEGKNDDGETGAGAVILRLMQKEHVTNCVICVTRWFGGIKLQGDRFKHISDATKYALSTSPFID